MFTLFSASMVVSEHETGGLALPFFLKKTLLFTRQNCHTTNSTLAYAFPKRPTKDSFTAASTDDPAKPIR
jgi:hypothetical protein